VADKKILIKLLQQEQKKYEKQYPNKGGIPRDYFRKQVDTKQMTEIEKEFGSFANFRNESGIESARQKQKKKTAETLPFVALDTYSNKNKRYFISSIIAGADIDTNFIKTVKAYCKKIDAEFLLMPMRGIKRADAFSDKILEEYEQYFVNEVKFNDNLKAIDFCLSPEQILPLTGLSRYGKKESSIIIASPKQMLLSIPRKKESLPHIILSTGTICEPEYNHSKIGKLAAQDNIIGGLLVEIRNKETFHIRHIRADKDGGFQDLAYYYKGTSYQKIAAEAISIEPHYGVEDSRALQAVKEIITETQCKRVLFHDILDCRSVNPHEQKSTSMKYYRPENQKTLENELVYLGNKMLEWNKDFPKIEMKVVASNHELFIRRYLESGDFIQETHNSYLGCELLQAILRKENPIEYYLKTRFAKIKNLFFLKEDASYAIYDIELNSHGHNGSNGSRGNPQVIENINGKSTIGHSHAPRMFRDVFVTGCVCQLQQDYNFANAGTSWLHGAVVQYKNGQRQLIIIIDGKWKI